MHLLDLTYHGHPSITRPEEVRALHAPAIGFARFVKKPLHIRFVKHAGFEGSDEDEGIAYQFFTSKNSFWRIPFRTHRFVNHQAPDVVLVQGLAFPLQVLHLLLTKKGTTRLLLQHHGESPYRGIKGWIQKRVCRRADGFVFTSAGNAQPWREQGFIRSSQPVFELLEASTPMQRLPKQESRSRLGMGSGPVFLWVGRLHRDKDPLTALSAFTAYHREQPGATLYMIFQSTELLEQVDRKISDSGMGNAIFLVGRMANRELATWFSAADFYLSASRREGSGYALLEAMACGCIPVVTDIPSFSTITRKGQFGFLYRPGDASALFQLLITLHRVDVDNFSALVEEHFHSELTFRRIAEDLAEIVAQLVHTPPLPNASGRVRE